VIFKSLGKLGLKGGDLGVELAQHMDESPHRAAVRTGQSSGRLPLGQRALPGSIP